MLILRSSWKICVTCGLDRFAPAACLHSRLLAGLMFVSTLFLPILGSFIQPSTALADPLKAVQKSRLYKKTLGSTKKHIPSKDLYSKKWFNPGSFYGQVFLRENGEQLLFEWLAPPKAIYSPVTTTVTKESEFFKAVRSYLDDQAKEILVTVLLPHPRSLEAIHQGLIGEFVHLIPKDTEIVRKSELILKDQKATLYVLQNGKCTILIPAARETMVEAKVESCNQEENLVRFAQNLDVVLFNQRLQS